MLFPWPHLRWAARRDPSGYPQLSPGNRQTEMKRPEIASACIGQIARRAIAPDRSGTSDRRGTMGKGMPALRPVGAAAAKTRPHKKSPLFCRPVATIHRTRTLPERRAAPPLLSIGWHQRRAVSAKARGTECSYRLTRLHVMGWLQSPQPWQLGIRLRQGPILRLQP